MLSLSIQGDAREPERVLLVTQPSDGVVHVREWSSDEWREPREYDLRTEDLLAQLERAVERRRRVSEELHHVRRWLGVER
jgi:hypothetical protein